VFIKHVDANKLSQARSE